MMRRIAHLAAALSLLAAAATLQAVVPPLHADQVVAPPVARVVPKEFKEFSAKRVDNYDWLRDRDDPHVIDLLRAENNYADARLKPLRPLVNEIAAELKVRRAAA